MRWAFCSCCRRRCSCSCFLTYPLGVGTWLGFTDTRIGRAGHFIGLENYQSLWQDSVFWLSVFNTVLYTGVASVLKFALGLWLALILNENLPFKSFFRAVVLLPWVVPTVLSAIAFWWIYDSQFSIISWALMKFGWISAPINFLGDPPTRAPRSSPPMSGAAFRSSPSRCSPACRPFPPSLAGGGLARRRDAAGSGSAM
jgi:ABC-type sugar transport system permease subunit